MKLRLPFRSKGPTGYYTVLAITIAFENTQVIREQIKQFRLYAVRSNDFKLIVVDNSISEITALKIRKICHVNKVDYYRLSKNPYSGIDPSKSHGYALNWASKNIVKRYQSEWFGFLDHDIFLLGNISLFVSNLLDSCLAYGVINKKDKKWYFWPGFCFLRRSHFDYNELDFMPATGMDTGGSNWSRYYIHLKPAEYAAADLKTIYPKNTTEKNKQRDAYEVIDGIWLHLVNASNWANVDMHPKQEKLGTLVRKLTDRMGESRDEHN